MPQVRAYFVVNEQRIDLKFEETSVGRLTSNFISINDPTVSKNHALIHFVPSAQLFYLTDLNTVNGTFLNGKKIQSNKKHIIKHKDSVQFDINLYNFYQTQPESDKKGKINLKDYCFQLQQDQDLSLSQSMSPVNPSKGQKSRINAKVQPVKAQPFSRPTKSVKIPQLADYLQLQASLLSSNPSVPLQKQSNKQRNDKVSLVNKETTSFEQAELNRLRQEEERRKNVYLEMQAEKMARQEKGRALEQQKIRLQVQRHRQEQQMLRKQIEIEQRVREQQEKMSAEKRRVQQQLLRRQQLYYQRQSERRQRQRRAEQQQKQKERRFVQQLRQQKQQQLNRIREQEQKLRLVNENAMKSELQNRKKQLQMQAQALASQYEQIYKQTIRKMKNDIEKEQTEIEQLQRSIEKAKQEKADYELKINQLSQAVEYSQKQFDQVLSRNKAFILYASELQNRLDSMKASKQGKLGEKRAGNIYNLRQNIESSRKLLSMKRGQLRSLEEQIKKVRLSLSMDKRMSHSQMLQTIVSNHQDIQRSKYLYFQFLRQQKALKQMWQFSLEQNDHLQQQNQNIEKDNQGHRKQLMNNLRDNASRLTEQRIHMLKCLHYLPQEKKRAAKLLIEEMVAMEDQIKTMAFDCEQAHQKINSLIINSQRLKSQNEYLSTLLFGADSTAHHFDNMKIEINDLIERIGLQRDEARVPKRLKIADQVQSNQIKIHESSKKLQALKNRWRQGLKTQKVLLSDKNPISFFGDILAKKQGEIQQMELKTGQAERQFASISLEIDQLQKKKGHLSDSLENFKRDQLAKVRQDIM